MKLTPAEIEYTRQVAAEIGADPAALIAEGEQLKETGYQQAYQASAATMAVIQGVGVSMAGGPAAEHEAEAG